MPGSIECNNCRTCKAYYSTCSPLQDAVCMPNDVCPVGWELDSQTLVCSMCAKGYINISNACVKCPSNFFCLSTDSYEVCQDIRIFERAGRFVTVPSSPEGSYHSTNCSCSEAGGFEGGSTVGLLGCLACRSVPLFYLLALVHCHL